MNWTYITELDAFEIYQKLKEQTASDKVAEAAASLLPALKNATSGASGTALSNVVTYPLDLVVTRLQVQSKSPSGDDGAGQRYDGVFDAVDKIYNNEGGIEAFYAGVSHDTFKSVVDSFLFFLAYNIAWRIRKGFGASTNSFMQVVDGLGVGCVAGAATKALTMPIQNVVTRKQTEAAGKNTSVADIIQTIRREKGIAGFWSGYSASLVLTLNPAVTFFLDAFWRRVLKTGNKPNPAMTFILAANGKATASLLMYPFKIAKARAQTAGKKATKDGRQEVKGPPENVFAAISYIARNEGLASLYAGVWGEVMKGFFSHGLTMVFKERIQFLAVQLYYVLSTLLKRQSKLKQ